MIVPMGEWVLAEAARQLECWSADGADAAALVMAVNLSPRQFADPGLVDMVTRVLAESAIPPTRLCLEITESTVASDGAGAAAALRAISSLGVALAIDDFGTGYSSLGALGEFPIDVLKIDRSFVGRLGDARRLGVVGAVVTLAQSLGLKAVTEGVERRDQVGELRRLGCDAAQGNLFCRPRAAADVAALLRAEFEVAP